MRNDNWLNRPQFADGACSTLSTERQKTIEQKSGLNFDGHGEHYSYDKLTKRRHRLVQAVWGDNYRDCDGKQRQSM